MITVCHECPDRSVGCHSICERYIEELKQHREQAEAIRRDKMVDNMLNEHRSRAVTKRLKRHGRTK